MMFGVHVFKFDPEDLRHLPREEIDAKLGIVRADRFRAGHKEIAPSPEEEAQLAALEQNYLYGVGDGTGSSLPAPKFFACLVGEGCVLGFGILLGGFNNKLLTH